MLTREQRASVEIHSILLKTQIHSFIFGLTSMKNISLDDIEREVVRVVRLVINELDPNLVNRHFDKESNPFIRESREAFISDEARENFQGNITGSGP